MKFTPGCAACAPVVCAQICVTTTGCTVKLDGVTVSVTGPGTIGGSPCTTTGVVSAVSMTSQGTAYTTLPSVSLSGGGGSGATAITVLTSQAVSSLSLDNGGSGYTTRPTITFSGGGGSGAGATTTLGPTSVGSLTITSGGAGYTSAPTVTISGGAGSGATATCTIAGPLSSITRTAGGSGYTTATVAFSGGGGSGAAATANLSGGIVTSFTVTAGGSGYSSAPTVTVTGNGTGATGTANLNRAVNSITLTNGGSGYTNAPAVSFSVGAATAVSGLTPGPVASIVLAAAGSGYTSAPTVVFAGGGGGSGAAATAIMRVLFSVSVTAGGSGYTSVPTVAFSGGGGSGATANAFIAARCCVDISMTGSYTVTAAKTGWNTQISTFTATCGVANTALPNLTRGVITLTVNGCGFALPGVTVTLKQSGTTLETGTTNGSGVYAFAALPSGTYDMTASLGPRYADGTTSVTLGNNCNGAVPVITLAPATGYVCAFGCILPSKTTLILTDYRMGLTITVTYATSGINGDGYYGSKAGVSIPACSDADEPTCRTGGTADIAYYFDRGSNTGLSAFTSNATPACLGSGGAFPVHRTVTCPPSLLLSWSYQNAGGIEAVYCTQFANSARNALFSAAE